MHQIYVKKQSATLDISSETITIRSSSNNDVIIKMQTQYCFAVTHSSLSSSSPKLSSLDISQFASGESAIAIHYLQTNGAGKKPHYRPFQFSVRDAKATDTCLQELKDVVCGPVKSILVLVNPFSGISRFR